jgi:hypothetical protein
MLLATQRLLLISVGRAGVDAFFLGGTRFLLGLALLVRSRACVFFGAALRFFCFAALRLSLGSSAILLIGAALRFLGGTSLCISLCRNASVLLGSTRFLLGFAHPLCRRANLLFGAPP